MLIAHLVLILCVYCSLCMWCVYVSGPPPLPPAPFPTPAYTLRTLFPTLRTLFPTLRTLILDSHFASFFGDSCTKTVHLASKLLTPTSSRFSSSSQSSILSQNEPKWGQDAPRWSQDTPRWSQDAPKWSPDGPKMEPRCSNLLLFGAYLSSHCTLLFCACLCLSPFCVSCGFSHFDAPLTHILIVRVYAETC